VGNFLGASSPAGRSLRELLNGNELVVAPGAYDALSARVVESAGFPAVYMTGYGTTAGLLGRPDVGLLGQSEMVDNARRMAQAVDVPLISDADTGYGNQINVIRTIAEFERAGVAAVHIEDQVTPKKCGHMSGKQLVAAEEMARKVEAAVAARANPEFMLIARTDAVAVEGLDGALERAKRYRDAGADMLFVEAPRTREEIEKVAETFSDIPLLFNWVEGGRSPAVSLQELQELGFRLVIFPVSMLFAATSAMRSLAGSLRTNGVPTEGQTMNFDEFVDFIGLADIQSLEERFQ
jgi:carboxyvinyl-carboxyphosphonate phosphorylmutase